MYLLSCVKINTLYTSKYNY